TVFRQIAMNQFEDRVHTARRDEGELSVERFGELWTETQTDFLGDSVEVTDNYGIWWSYIPHFIASPGYVYAYAYGQLLALSVYRLYTERGEEIVPSYLEMLAAGGSRSAFFFFAAGFLRGLTSFSFSGLSSSSPLASRSTETVVPEASVPSFRTSSASGSSM